MFFTKISSNLLHNGRTGGHYNEGTVNFATQNIFLALVSFGIVRCFNNIFKTPLNLITSIAVSCVIIP